MVYIGIRLHQFKFTLVILLSLMIMACSTEVPSISPKQAAELFANNEAIIVDVREQDEWDEHHIEGAIFIPLATLDKRIEELAQYKDRPIIMQCRSGKRSTIASKSLIKAGFTKVQNLEGGILAWDEAGLETTQGKKGAK